MSCHHTANHHGFRVTASWCFVTAHFEASVVIIVGDFYYQSSLGLPTCLPSFSALLALIPSFLAQPSSSWVPFALWVKEWGCHRSGSWSKNYLFHTGVNLAGYRILAWQSHFGGSCSFAGNLTFLRYPSHFSLCLCHSKTTNCEFIFILASVDLVPSPTPEDSCLPSILQNSLPINISWNIASPFSLFKASF